jgi:thioredoxin-like negative regulator of GroEL
MHAGKPAEAIAALQQVLEMNNQFPTAHYRIALCRLLMNNPELALAELDLEPAADWKLHGLALAHVSLGNKATADSLLKVYITDNQEVSAFQIAEVYGHRKENKEALTWLTKAYDHRDGGLTTLAGNPWLTSVVTEPEYRALLKKMGFE